MSDQLREALEGWERNTVFIAKSGGKENARLLYQAAREHLSCGTITDEMVERAARAFLRVEGPFPYVVEDDKWAEWWNHGYDSEDSGRDQYEREIHAALVAALGTEGT